MDNDGGMPNDWHDSSGSAASRSKGGAVRQRAVRLLQQLLRRDFVTIDALSVSLSVSPPKLLEYLEGKERMPRDSQRRLAALIVEQVPELASEGRRLQLQCAAEERFHAGETRTHVVAPAGRFR